MKTDLWFSETLGDLRASWRIRQVLYHQRSELQDILVVDTLHFGRMLILDGCVMTTDKDEFVYHEMIAHPALLAHPNPRDVCVVGGGDGGTVREVLRHSTVKRAVLAEIDSGVIEVCREYFPALAGDLDDPRVKIQVGDGAKYLAEHPGEFDVVLSDSTDPIGPGEVLFQDDYFRTAKQALRPGGVFVTQCESFWLGDATVNEIAARMRQHFRIVLPYMASIPTYPTGTWLFLLASDDLDPRRGVDAARQKTIIEQSRYYTEELQTAAFAVPAFLRAGKQPRA